VARVQLHALTHREARLRRRLLQDRPDTVPPLGSGARGIGSEHAHVAVAALAKALEDLDRRRLPGAVRAEEGEDLSAVDLEVDAGDGVQVAVALAQPADADDHVVHRLTLAQWVLVADRSRPSLLAGVAALASAAAEAGADRLTVALGGRERARVIVVLACVLGLSAADVSTVGASATELRRGLHISNTDIGLLVAATSLVGAVASLPFGILADRIRRTTTLSLTIVLWAVAMLSNASVSSFGDLLIARVVLGAVTAAAGPMIASLVGDYFGGWERGRIYGYILTGELLGAGFGFAVTGDIAAASWRAAFVILGLPAPRRGGMGVLAHETEEPPEEAELDDEPHQTDAQRLAREAGIEPDPDL